MRLWSQKVGVAVKFREGTGEKVGEEGLGNALSEDCGGRKTNKHARKNKKMNKQKNKPIKRSMTAECIYRNF